MRIIGVKTKTGCVRYDRGSKSKPWEAILHIAGKRKRVGRYETRELAEAAVQGARRGSPLRSFAAMAVRVLTPHYGG
jgi:hypothetical protein